MVELKVHMYSCFIVFLFALPQAGIKAFPDPCTFLIVFHLVNKQFMDTKYRQKVPVVIAVIKVESTF